MIITAVVACLQLHAPPAKPAAQRGNVTVVPVVTAVRPRHAPRIDGRLNEPAWATAPAITSFWEMSPNEGERATQRTVVRILYDNEALYVGARMFERDPRQIRAVLTRRDATSPSDYFTIALDTYHDHRTAMVFTVNPLGVRLDDLTSGDLSVGDISWDPVWEVATRIDSLGWTAELRIPLSQLRFPARAEQVWGINLFRHMSSRQEDDAFVLVRQSEVGYASRFGHLLGIRDVPSPHRLELLPYARTQLETQPVPPGDPLSGRRTLSQSGGLDLKYGVSSSYSLAATVNPDFGQVEADPAVLNLTQFETFFEERRPFFTEGSQIFAFSGTAGEALSGEGPEFFYSRRIGRAPSLYPNLLPILAVPADSIRGPFVKVPPSTTILGAFKLTGRSPGGTSLGILHAETAAEFGQVYATMYRNGSALQRQYSDEVEPRAHYSVFRATQDLRGGATTIGVLLTNVYRELGTPRLDSTFRDRATTGGIDWQHRWHSNRLSLGGYLGWSDIHGSRAAIAQAQMAPERYFQRPDQRYLHVDSTRTTLVGWTGEVRFGYDAASGFNAAASGSSRSPGFETNDLGFLTTADERATSLSVGWRSPRPSRRIQTYGITAFRDDQWTTDGTHLHDANGISILVAAQSGWIGSVNLSVAPRALTWDATRGGPLMATGRTTSVSYSLSSDVRRALSIVTTGYRNRSAFGDRSHGVQAFLTWRPAPNIQLAIGPDISSNHSTAFYATAVSDPLATSTYGRRYVFATVDQRSLSLTPRADVTLSPSLSIQLYTQLFTASGRYSGFKELRRPRSFSFLRYGTDDGSVIERDTAGNYRADPDGGGPAPPLTMSNPDVAVRSLRGTLVLRWEYRPGATLFAVWTQQRSEFDRTGNLGGLGGLPTVFALPPENVLLLKASYWLNW